MIAAGVDHVSAYSLIVEDGTRMAARMRRGELPYPDDDVAADRYLAAEAALGGGRLRLVRGVELGHRRRPPGAGTTCSTGPAATGGGSGPGAHSHVGGVRWWNVKHPAAYAERLADGVSPGHGRELLTDADRHVEDVMLRVRLAEGLPLARWTRPGGRRRPGAGGRPARAGARTRPAGCVLTLRGRLLADAVVRDLLP